MQSRQYTHFFEFGLAILAVVIIYIFVIRDRGCELVQAFLNNDLESVVVALCLFLFLND